MKSFVKRMLLFSIPLIIYVILALCIDPYNIVFQETNPKMIELKSQISYKLNYPLYKLKEFSDHPTDIILLGDSRTNKLESNIFDSLTKMKSTNLAYGGGTLPEIIETFWYCSKVHDLKEVYIGINFNIYNASNNMNRVTEAIDLKSSPISYLFSRYCYKSTLLITKSLVTNETKNIEKPDLTKEEFWEYQLESSANNFFRDYKYPTQYFTELSKISQYCKKENINLVFFIPPTHIDLQEKVNEFELVEAQEKFRMSLSKIGRLYDFDYPNKLTQSKENFTDPFHFTDSIAKIVIDELVTGNVYYARTLDYKPVTYFGGKADFLKTVKRDQMKKQRCNRNGFELNEVKCDED